MAPLGAILLLARLGWIDGKRSLGDLLDAAAGDDEQS